MTGLAARAAFERKFDDRAIELRVGAPFQFRQGVAGLARLLVSPVAVMVS